MAGGDEDLGGGEVNASEGRADPEVRRTAFDQDGQPFRLTISVYPTDRNQFTVNVGDVPDEIPEPTPRSVDQPHQNGLADPVTESAIKG